MRSIIRFLFVSLFLVPSLAFGQFTPTQIQGQINANFYTGADTTGPEANSVLNNMNVSYVAILLLGANVYTALQLPLNGSGAITATTSPAFVTPALGTPASGTLTNTTGFPLANLAGADATFLAAGAIAVNTTGGVFTQPVTWVNGHGTKIGPSGGLVDTGAIPGTVTSLTTGPGLYSGTITATGTISLADRHTEGRLTLQSGVPVMTASQSAQTTLYYAPYIGSLISIYNGTNLQAYQFTSSASDTVGLSIALGSNWAANSVYDVFVALNSSTPTLCTVVWTSTTARATSLAIYNGILTNSAQVTCRYSNSATLTVPANQATYVGSVYTNGSTGTIDYTFGGAASGGTAATFGVWNYYNRVSVQTSVKDSGSTYTYSSATVRQARASAGNQVTFLTGVAEDAVQSSYTSGVATSSNLNSFTNFGIGLDTTSAFTNVYSNCNSNSNAVQRCQTTNTTTLQPAIGQHVLSANEGGDGGNTNTLDNYSLNTLFVTLRQ